MTEDAFAARRAGTEFANQLAAVIRHRLEGLELTDMMVASYLRQPLSETTRKLDGLQPWSTVELCRLAQLLGVAATDLLAEAESGARRDGSAPGPAGPR